MSFYICLPNEVCWFDFDRQKKKRVNNLIGKVSPCRGDRCRIKADLTRKEKLLLVR